MWSCDASPGRVCVNYVGEPVSAGVSHKGLCVGVKVMLEVETRHNPLHPHHLTDKFYPSQTPPTVADI